MPMGGMGGEGRFRKYGWEVPLSIVRRVEADEDGRVFAVGQEPEGGEVIKRNMGFGVVRRVLPLWAGRAHGRW
jgi:hypothetical protein